MGRYDGNGGSSHGSLWIPWCTNLLCISLAKYGSNLVGGWASPLKNISSSVGMMTNMESHKTCSSHHQPVTIWNMWDIALKWLPHHWLGPPWRPNPQWFFRKKPNCFSSCPGPIKRDNPHHHFGVVFIAYLQLINLEVAIITQIESAVSPIESSMFHSYPLVMTFTVRHGKIHRMLKFGKPSISIRAIIFHGELLVITRGYIPLKPPFCWFNPIKTTIKQPFSYGFIVKSSIFSCVIRLWHHDVHDAWATHRSWGRRGRLGRAVNIDLCPNLVVVLGLSLPSGYVKMVENHKKTIGNGGKKWGLTNKMVILMGCTLWLCQRLAIENDHRNSEFSH